MLAACLIGLAPMALSLMVVLLIQDPRSHRWELPGGIEAGEAIR